MYLDHNATTPLDPEVLEAMMPYLREQYGNPSSMHRLGRAARAAVDRAREEVAALVDAHPSQVIFTSGGSEANNLAVKGVLAGMTPDAGLLTSSIEHPSLLRAAAFLERRGHPVRHVAPNARGEVECETFLAAVTPDTKMASLMLVNNETGVVQAVRGVGEELRGRGVPFHTDAVQAAGKTALSFPRLQVDLMSLSAHKLYGPKGVGALVARREIALEPLLHGGGQERKQRGGTENVAGIVGFGAAARLAMERLEGERIRLTRLREHVLGRIKALLPETVVFGEGAERVANTLCIAVPGIAGETLLMNLDLAGILVSSGSACASGSREPSPALLAMGLTRDLARSAIRISLGRDNTEAQMDRFADELYGQISRLQDMAKVAS